MIAGVVKNNNPEKKPWMNVAGIEIGSRNTKAVILKDGKVLTYAIVASIGTPEANARSASEAALAKAGLSWEDLQYIVSTGLGCEAIPFAQKIKRNFLLCLAKGANWLFPTARTVIDIGANNGFAIKIGARGELNDFAKADVCAAGSGTLIESVANLLDMPLEELSNIPVTLAQEVRISNTCAIFIEQEVISLLHAVHPITIGEIVSGIYTSLASRVKGLVAKIGAESDIVLCGGIARNAAFSKILEEEMGVKVLIGEEPQIVPSLGAALIACEELKRLLLIK